MLRLSYKNYNKYTWQWRLLAEYVWTNKCVGVVTRSCYVFSSIVVLTPTDNLCLVPLLHSVSGVSVRTRNRCTRSVHGPATDLVQWYARTDTARDRGRTAIFFEVKSQHLSGWFGESHKKLPITLACVQTEHRTAYLPHWSHKCYRFSCLARLHLVLLRQKRLSRPVRRARCIAQVANWSIILPEY